MKRAIFYISHGSRVSEVRHTHLIFFKSRKTVVCFKLSLYKDTVAPLLQSLKIVEVVILIVRRPKWPSVAS